jgi:hypothetical protein
MLRANRPGAFLSGKRQMSPHHSECPLAVPAVNRRDAAAQTIDGLALVFGPDRKQDQRLVEPIVGIVAVGIADGAGVGLVENKALVLALEVEDQLLVGADFFAFDAAMVTRTSRPPRSEALSTGWEILRRFSCHLILIVSEGGEFDSWKPGTVCRFSTHP